MAISPLGARYPLPYNSTLRRRGGDTPVPDYRESFVAVGKILY